MQKYEPIGLKTMDGKEIMTYTKEYYFTYVKPRLEKASEIYEQMLIEEAREKERKQKQNMINHSFSMLVSEEEEPYISIIPINKKHDKLFKEMLSNKKEVVNFLKLHLNMDLSENEIEKYQKEFRTSVFGSIEADIVYKIKDKDYFILIEHQSTIDDKMAYRIQNYKQAIIDSAIDTKRLKDKTYKIPKVLAIVLYTGKRKWKKQELKDIEEKLEGFTEPNEEYKLIDVNDFSKKDLLEDNLITSKAMLIESSKGKEELYQNIEDVIDNQENLDGDKEENNQQLETLIKYELTGTENENIIKKFIEKIKNGKGDETDMTNASRIINREMRAREKAAKNEGMLLGISQGISKGIAMMAKKLKDKMSIEEICQLTGLSEQQIENL